jgi:cystathionine beta-lyase
LESSIDEPPRKKTFNADERNESSTSTASYNLNGGGIESRKMSLETRLISYNPCENDPYGAAVMPIYQTATFAQPAATTFGDYDYTRSGNPTRDALQNQLADLEVSFFT